VRYCGIDVSAKPGNQQLVTLHERRGRETTYLARGSVELVATFYEPGDVESVARTVLGFGGSAAVAIDAPSGRCAGLLSAGAPLRSALGLPEGRYERSRVCDALLIRRGLPLYPVPATGGPVSAWQHWMEVGFKLFEELNAAEELYRPQAPDGLVAAPVGEHALRFGRVFETFPDAVFCTLLGHRPSPKRTPSGLQQRIAALRMKRIVDPDGGLWQRTIDELDACAAAYAAYALATGQGSWVGDPSEGVIVLPVSELKARYEKLPPPVREPLA
jgi:predicted nuclease with RNAse H fold